MCWKSIWTVQCSALCSCCVDIRWHWHILHTFVMVRRGNDTECVKKWTGLGRIGAGHWFKASTTSWQHRRSDSSPLLLSHLIFFCSGLLIFLSVWLSSPFLTLTQYSQCVIQAIAVAKWFKSTQKCLHMQFFYWPHKQNCESMGNPPNVFQIRQSIHFFNTKSGSAACVTSALLRLRSGAQNIDFVS